MRFLADAAAELIVKRTRAGFGVKSFRAQRTNRLLSLDPDYIAYRRRKKLDSTTSPGKSNLTFTGQLLRSIKGNVTKEGRAVINFKDRRRGERLTNTQLAEYVEEQGRPFLYLAKTEQLKLAKFYEKTFSAILKNKGLR